MAYLSSEDKKRHSKGVVKGLPQKEWLDIFTGDPHSESLTGFIKQNVRAAKCQKDSLLPASDTAFNYLLSSYSKKAQNPELVTLFVQQFEVSER